MDAGRRRILRLGLLGAATMAGSAYLLVDRLRNGEEGETVARTADGGAAPSTRPTSSTSTSSATPGDREPAVTTSTPAATTEPSSADATGSSTAAAVMLCRESWGAAAPNRAVPPHQVKGVMVHHTAVVLDDNRKSPDRIRGHQRYHQSKGFADIAYHVFIDAHGNIYEGRDPATPGETFTDYDPTGWFLVVCEGNFDDQPLPDPQRDSLARVLGWACAHYGVPVADIASHRQHAHTRCPGDAIHSLLLDGTIARLAGQASTADIPEICGAEADSRITLIRAGSL